MLLIGLIFFLFLLVLLWSGIVWIVGKIGKCKGQEKKYKKYTIYLGVFIAVATVLFLIADEIYTKKQFEQLCKKEAGLKIYKKVDNVDGFLHMSDDYDNPKYFVKDIKKFKFYENMDRNNEYKIKEYYTKKENNQYIIDYFIVMTERKYIGKGKYKENLVKESQIDFDDYKINRYSFADNEEYLKEENIQPRSRYILLKTHHSVLNKFGLSKTIIFDIQDYSIMAEYTFIGSGGGKWSHFLGSFYGGGSAGSCGYEQGKIISSHNLVKQIFQPTVQ